MYQISFQPKEGGFYIWKLHFCILVLVKRHFLHFSEVIFGQSEIKVVYKAVSSNFRVAFVGIFLTKKCGDGNRCSVDVQGEEGCCFLSQMDDKS
jgi:hypothetical protein